MKFAKVYNCIYLSALQRITMGKVQEVSPAEDEEIEKTKLKKKKDRIQKKKQKEEELGLYSRDDLDLDRETFPIAYFIGDKKDMIEQIFSIVNGARLQAMLPPLLKPLPLGELKQLCLQQLSRLSAKKIQAILAGHELGPGLSSESEAESMSASSDSVVSVPQKKKRKKKLKETKRKKKKEIKEKRPADKEENDNKTLMELLELEMRAKAIKALLENETKNKEATETEKNSNTDIKTEVHEVIAVEQKTEVGIADEDADKTISGPPNDEKKMDVVSHESSEEEIGEIRTGDADKGTIRWISNETKKVKQKKRRREKSEKFEKTRRQYRKRGATLSTPSLSSEEGEQDVSGIKHTIPAANEDQIENIESEEGEFSTDENEEKIKSKFGMSECRTDEEEVESESEETMDEDYDVHVESPSSDEKEDSIKEMSASTDESSPKEVEKLNVFVASKGEIDGLLSPYILQENAEYVKSEEKIQQNRTNTKTQQAVDKKKSFNEDYFSDESNSSGSTSLSTCSTESLDDRVEEKSTHQVKETVCERDESIDDKKSKGQSTKEDTTCKSENQGVENQKILDGRNTKAQNLNEIIAKGNDRKNENVLKREQGQCAQKEASIDKMNDKEKILDDKQANQEILDDHSKGEDKNAKEENLENKEVVDEDKGYVNDKQPEKENVDNRKPKSRSDKILEDKESIEINEEILEYKRADKESWEHRKRKGNSPLKENERAEQSVITVDDKNVETEGKKDESTLKVKESNEHEAPAADDGFWKGDYDDIDVEEEVREEDILNDFNFNTDSAPVVVEYKVERPLTKFTFQSAKRSVPSKGRLKRINFGSSRSGSLEGPALKNPLFIKGVKESKECVVEEGKEIKEITVETTQKFVPPLIPQTPNVPERLDSGDTKIKNSSTEESWKSRYVTSDKVQKIVETSKILSKVRSKIKEKATKEMENQEKNLEQVGDKTVVIGTLEEYERISGKKVGATSEIIDDNEEEDEEESALWSDIFGK